VFSIPVGVVFRPSEAKVKNVRTRDYLGKARLVAQASDRRNVSMDQWAKDDRPPENLSYVASHLVRPGLSSRSRQKSEPPMNRNLFPPTPPPESDKPTNARPPKRVSSDNSANFGPPQRAPSSSSKRSHSATRKPERLELGLAAFERPAPREQSRRGTARSASERPAERRYDRHSNDSDTRHRPTRERLFGAMDNDGVQEELTAQMQQQKDRILHKSHTMPQRTSQLRPEFDEEEESDVGHTPRSVVTEPRSAAEHYYRSHHWDSRTSSRAPPRIRKIRVKVHFVDDTRYIIVAPSIPFAEFVEQIARKFGVKGGIRVKTRDDEGDTITMADQEDLEIAVGVCRDMAGTEGVDVGKMEVCVLVLSACINGE